MFSKNQVTCRVISADTYTDVELLDSEDTQRGKPPST